MSHSRSHTFGGESALNGNHFQQYQQHPISNNSTSVSRPFDISDGSSNGIIRIHSDSQQSLDRLFNPPTGEVTNVVPLRQRNLPSSFFNPRGSSQAIKMEDQHQQQQQQQPQQQIAHHYRNYSSPSFMANQLAPSQTQAQPNLHHRQGSSSESFGYMTIASSSSSINQPQQLCHQAGTIVQQQQTTHHFNNSHCSSSSNSDQYLHNNNTLHNNNNNHHKHNHHHQQQQTTYVQPQTQLVQPQQQAYMQPQAQLVQQQPVQPAHPQPQVQQQQQVVHHYRNYSSPAYMTNQIGQNGSLAQAVPQPQVQASLPRSNLHANLHLRQASSSESFEYVTQTNGVGAGHHHESQVHTHYNVNHHAQQQQHHQPHCQQVADISAQQQPNQFSNQHCSSNLDQNQNYHHQHAQPESAQLAGSTMLARSFMRQPPYGVSSLGQ